jgi:hypothetical protein
MVELHNWLSHQHSGLRTYVTLQQMTNELAKTDAEHRAVYKLLSSIIDPFIASFDEEPLPAGVAESTFQRLLAVVRDADNAISLAPDQQIEALNKIAAVDLL